jgi:hypothetical protein
MRTIASRPAILRILITTNPTPMQLHLPWVPCTRAGHSPRGLRGASSVITATRTV